MTLPVIIDWCRPDCSSTIAPESSVKLSAFKLPVNVNLPLPLKLIFSHPQIATLFSEPSEVDEPIRCVFKFNVSISEEPATRVNLLPPSTIISCDISTPSLINRVSLPVPSTILPLIFAPSFKEIIESVLSFLIAIPLADETSAPWFRFI